MKHETKRKRTLLVLVVENVEALFAGERNRRRVAWGETMGRGAKRKHRRRQGILEFWASKPARTGAAQRQLL